MRVIIIICAIILIIFTSWTLSFMSDQIVRLSTENDMLKKDLCTECYNAALRDGYTEGYSDCVWSWYRDTDEIVDGIE